MTDSPKVWLITGSSTGFGRSLRLVLGKYAYSKFRQKIASLTQELDAWEAMATNTDFEDILTTH